MMLAKHSKIWFLPRPRRLFPAGGAECSNDLTYHPIRLFPAECSNDWVCQPMRLSLAPAPRLAGRTFNTSLTSYISNLIQTQTPAGRNTNHHNQADSDAKFYPSSDGERVLSIKFNTNINYEVKR
jgi:hypothetical protein